jgi:outer membrane protein OmpA-like peptidoglycan-associated protein
MNKLTIALLLVSTPAVADRKIEAGLALGAHAFSGNTELGVTDNMTEPGPESSGLLGARAAFGFTSRLAAEAELVWIPTQDDVLGNDATVYGLRAHARFDLLQGRVRPFVVAGLGAHIIRSSSPQMDNDADKELHWGGGVRYALKDAIDLRFDVRHHIVPGRTYDGATSDLEATVGMTYRFGKQPAKPAPVIVDEPAPVVAADDDIDRDGLVNDVDKCPTVAETRNGYQDTDGCPDAELPELAGIGFEPDSATIDIDSAPILERAYALLVANPGISIEVAGHTSSEGDSERNLKLSLARAEAVKAYLVKRGIVADRVQTVGHGEDMPISDNRTHEGRRLNRRIELRILTGD